MNRLNLELDGSRREVKDGPVGIHRYTRDPHLSTLVGELQAIDDRPLPKIDHFHRFHAIGDEVELGEVRRMGAVGGGPVLQSDISDELFRRFVEETETVGPDAEKMHLRRLRIASGRFGERGKRYRERRQQQSESEAGFHGNTRSSFRQSWVALPQVELQSGLLLR